MRIGFWKNRISRIFISSFLVVIVAAMTGCAPFDVNVSQSTKDLQAEAEDENLTIVGFSQLGSESAWRTANTKSVEDSLTQDKGFFLMSNNARQSQENQIKALRSFISQRVDYIVLCPVQEDGWETVLTEAEEAEIPVIILDRAVGSDCDGLYTTFVGENMQEEGSKAGKWLETHLSDKGLDNKDINIVVLQGTENSSAEIGRTAGFDNIAKEHPNWHILAQKDADFTTARGKEVMADYLKKYQKIDVLVSQNDDMTYGAIEAMDDAGVAAGSDVAVISFDATKSGLKLVQQGKVNVDIECNPMSGPLLAEVINKIEKGEKVQHVYYLDEKVFTKDNVDKFIDSRSY